MLQYILYHMGEHGEIMFHGPELAVCVLRRQGDGIEHILICQTGHCLLGTLLDGLVLGCVRFFGDAHGGTQLQNADHCESHRRSYDQQTAEQKQLSPQSPVCR